MSRCGFLVDECVPSALVRGLRRRCADVSVLQVGEPGAPTKGASDEQVLVYEATDAEEWRDQLHYLPLFPQGPDT